MFLERIEIENVRSIPSIELDFTDLLNEGDAVRKWSLVVGENGTGKSTVLKAIALLLAGSDVLPSLVGDCRSWVRHGEASARISARLRTAEWEPRDVSLEILPDHTVGTLLAHNASNLELLNDALRRATQNYFSAAYGPYRRISDEKGLGGSQGSRLPPRGQCLITLFDKNAVVNPLQSWAMTLEYRLGGEGLDIVQDAMNTLMPDVSFEGVDKERSTLRFRTPDGIVSLEELSDGYQNMAAWIGDLLYRITEAFAHRHRPLEARGLLLIDEIDAHIHPSWQRRLREFLTTKLPNFQIIATTHSALTLQQAHEGEAVILARDDNQLVRAEEFPGDPSKLRLHQLYDMAFRVSSLDSWEIEQDKEKYRELSKKGAALTGSEREELTKVQAKLEAIPEERGDSLGNESLEKYFSTLEGLTRSLASRTSGS